jgi:hypothetical protein
LIFSDSEASAKYLYFIASYYPAAEMWRGFILPKPAGRPGRKCLCTKDLRSIKKNLDFPQENVLDMTILYGRMIETQGK